MLVMFDSFTDFISNFVLCDKKGTPEKKNCPMTIATSVGLASHALQKTKKTVRHPRAIPRLTCGRNHPIKDLVNEPVLKANERYFNIRLKHRNQCYYFLAERVRRLLLPSEAAEVFGPSRRFSSHYKPNLKKSGTLYRLIDNQYPAWGLFFCAACLKSFLQPFLSKFEE